MDHSQQARSRNRPAGVFRTNVRCLKNAMGDSLIVPAHERKPRPANAFVAIQDLGDGSSLIRFVGGAGFRLWEVIFADDPDAAFAPVWNEDIDRVRAIAEYHEVPVIEVPGACNIDHWLSERGCV